MHMVQEDAGSIIKLMLILIESILMAKKFLNQTTSIVFLYISAIVVANNMVSMFGEIGLWVTGFFLIPFDLLARDILHEQWRGRYFI